MKLRRILALCGAGLLILLFVLALVLAVSGAAANTLMAVFFAILFISVVGYAMALMIRVLRRGKEDAKEDSEGGRKS